MSTPVTLAEEFEIAVFKKGVSVKGIASERISREEAQYYVDCGVARWVNNRYKSVQMLIEAVPCKLRGTSCKPNHWVLQNAVIEGQRSAIAIVNAWRHQFAA